jgi:serine/threonine protein kinase
MDNFNVPHVKLDGESSRIWDFYSCVKKLDLMEKDRPEDGFIDLYLKVKDKDDKIFFMKMVHKKHMNNKKQELELYKIFKNKYHGAVKLHAIYETPNHLIHILDYVEYDLFTYINEFTMTLNEIKSVFIQICDIIYFLYTNNVLYTDIKLENFLIEKVQDKLKVYLCDMDLYLKFDPAEHEPNKVYTTPTFLGGADFRAPETFINKIYSEKTLTWALGCILYAMCEKLMPFHSVLFSKHLKKTNLQYNPENYTAINHFKCSLKFENYRDEKDIERVRDLIHKLLDVNYHTRYDLIDIYLHELFILSNIH